MPVITPNANIPLQAGNIGIDLTQGINAINRRRELKDARGERETVRADERQERDDERARKAPLEKLQLQAAQQTVEANKRKAIEDNFNETMKTAAMIGISVQDEVSKGDLPAARSSLVRIAEMFTETEQPKFAAEAQEMIDLIDAGDLSAVQNAVTDSIEVGQQLGLTEAPKKAESTTGIKEFEFFQNLSETDQAAFTKFKEKTKSGTTVNVNPALGATLTPEQKVLQEVAIGGFKSTLEDGQEAPVLRAKNNNVRELLTSGTKTGKLSDPIIFLAQMGLPIDDATDLETIRAFTTEDIIPEVKKLGVNPTDFDFKQVVKSKAEVGKTTEGNLILVDMKDQILTRSEEHSKIIRTMSLAGEPFTEINRAMREHDTANPLKVMTLDEAIAEIKAGTEKAVGSIEDIKDVKKVGDDDLLKLIGVESGG